MTIYRTVIRTLSAPVAAVRSHLPSEKKARRAIASRFAAAVTRQSPSSRAPGFWPWAHA